MKIAQLRHEFVESAPDQLDEGVLYVSIKFTTTLHLCCCGCGNEVVLPLSPSAWQMNFDGETISLSPSVGNWSFSCRSHYWIARGRIITARSWTDAEVARARRDRSNSNPTYPGRPDQVTRTWHQRAWAALQRRPLAENGPADAAGHVGNRQLEPGD